MQRKVTDQEVYPAIWIVLGVLLMGYFLWKYVLGQPTVSYCWIYQHWHLYCPGCGGTRALIALLRGQVLKAFYYHPMVPLIAAWVLVYLISQTIQRLRRKGWALRYHPRWVVLFFGGFAVNCLLRNVLLQWGAPI